MSASLGLLAILLAATSGIPGVLLPRRSALGERIAVLLMIAGSGCGLAAALCAGSAALSVPWRVPGGELAVGIDGISAMFLAQVFVVAPLGAVYGLGYWPQEHHSDNGRKLRLFYGLMTAGMALLVVSRNAILFLVGWETMAIAAFFAVTTEDGNEAVRRSGFVYLVAARIGTLCLFGMFAVLRLASGTWAFAAPAQGTPQPLATAIFLLALAGFGLKAGIMPMHFWLPGAHANAPSHVSALMSGVLIKMGIYGLVRVSSFFVHPPLWWGVLLLALGAVSGVMGVAFAIGQHDLKRLLAYHSVENVGIIIMGLALAVLGRSLGQPELVALGLGGALLHVWNHGLFKALLFLSAGAVVHTTHTRDIDRLGGLARAMPYTGLAFLLGALAICGLPPLNGFVSELLVYLALLRAALLHVPGVWLTGAFGTPTLALIGSLALACFVKAFGAVFLGTPRSEQASGAREVSLSMRAPMFVLGACCVVIGIVPAAVTPALEAATRAWTGGSWNASIASVAPFGWLSAMAFGLVALALAVLASLAAFTRRPRAVVGVTWDCGYAAPSPRMQYTASSFGESLVGLLSWALRPVRTADRSRALFPREERFHTQVPDAVLDRTVLPAARAVATGLSWFRWLQRGTVQLYLLYLFAALTLALMFGR